MKKIILSFLLSSLFLIACDTTGNQDADTPYLGHFEESPTQFNGTIEDAYQQLSAAIQKFTSDRQTDGSLNKDNAPILISHILGILAQYPRNEKAAKKGFEVAELLTYANEHKNAARLFHLISTTFPKSESVGQAQLQLGMILNKNLKDKEGAITTYRAFIRDYPDHPLVGTAEGLLYELVR